MPYWMENLYYLFLLQKETPSDVQLHAAAFHGDLTLLQKVLDSGKVHVDCRDKVLWLFVGAIHK